MQEPGDIDILPAGADGSWEDDAELRILRLSLHPSLLHQAAGELGRDVDTAELVPRFQVRDARIEAIGRAVKAELEAGTPSDPLFVDHLANALAVCLTATAGEGSPRSEGLGGPRMSSRQLRVLTEYIESNPDQKLRLDDLAVVVGVSVTRLKALFRNRTGVTVHQYVIRRRVEHARDLLTTTSMSASDVAAAARFRSSEPHGLDDAPAPRTDAPRPRSSAERNRAETAKPA